MVAVIKFAQALPGSVEREYTLIVIAIRNHNFKPGSVVLVSRLGCPAWAGVYYSYNDNLAVSIAVLESLITVCCEVYTPSA